MNDYIKSYITENFNVENGNEFTYTIKNDSSNKTYDSGKDYLHKIFVRLTLPAIYSSSSRQFKWIKYLGYNIIKNAKCNIKFNNKTKTSTNIDLFTYTEWLYIWNEINLSEEEKKIHYELIGHTPELYDPANSSNRNNVYPVSHLNRETYKWIIDDTNTKKANIVNISSDFNYNKPASIPSKTIYIPLNFYFCNNIKDILPLSHIQEIKITITFRPINELYTVLLQPEDFTLSNSNSSITTTNYETNIRLPPSINFVNNKIPNFSNSAHLDSNSNINNLSMFDVLINKYEIKPLTNGNTSINNFLLDPTGDPINNNIQNIQTSVNAINLFYDNICKAQISLNLIKTTPYNKKNIKYSGLFSQIGLENVLDTNTNSDGSVKQYSFIISKNISEKINEMFVVFRHAERENKNDLLNFTNLDYNNKYDWNDSSKNNNTVSYSSNIELISNSKWEHESTNTSIRMGVDNLGVFYIKKHILEDNVFKYVDIINYKSEDILLETPSLYNSNSTEITNEKILDKFKLTVETKDTSDNKKTISNSSEPYNFYNKVTLYNKYNNTIPGLYYINNTYEKGISKLEFSLCDFNKITINESNEYKSIVFCNQEVLIPLKNI